MSNTDKYLGLTPDEFDRFKRACLRTWQTIGQDMINSLWANAGLSEMPRSDVIELVLDADHMRMYGEQFTKDWIPFYGLRLEPWISEHYHWPSFNRLMREVFPFEHYA
jgi:hypothetical protein